MRTTLRTFDPFNGVGSAAANFAVALGSDGMFKPGVREEIVRTVHAPTVVEDLLKRLDKAYSPDFLAGLGLAGNGTAPTGLTFVSRTIPVGTEVTEAKKESMTVEVSSPLEGRRAPEREGGINGVRSEVVERD